MFTARDYESPLACSFWNCIPARLPRSYTTRVELSIEPEILTPRLVCLSPRQNSDRLQYFSGKIQNGVAQPSKLRSGGLVVEISSSRAFVCLGWLRLFPGEDVLGTTVTLGGGTGGMYDVLLSLEHLSLVRDAGDCALRRWTHRDPECVQLAGQGDRANEVSTCDEGVRVG